MSIIPEIAFEKGQVWEWGKKGGLYYINGLPDGHDFYLLSSVSNNPDGGWIAREYFFNKKNKMKHRPDKELKIVDKE